MPIAPALLRLSAVAALACTAAFADTITLKSGEKLEGKITKETTTELTVEVKVSAGVTDEQIVPKANVEKIDKEQPDEVAWLPLKNLKLAQNSLQPAQYEAAMRPLQGFVNDFPQRSACEGSQPVTRHVCRGKGARRCRRSASRAEVAHCRGGGQGALPDPGADRGAISP